MYLSIAVSEHILQSSGTTVKYSKPNAQDAMIEKIPLGFLRRLRMDDFLLNAPFLRISWYVARSSKSHFLNPLPEVVKFLHLGCNF